MITSGSWRSACTSADSALGVSVPTSRWSTTARLSACNTSTGSSIVTMWHSRVRVHVVDHRRERRGLPRTCETGDEHEAVRLVGERGDRGRQRQRVEAGDAGEHPTQHESDPAALAERAHAEPAEAGDAVHEVGLVGGGELGPVRRRHDRERARLGLGRFDGVERRLAELAVDAQARPRANLDVHVRSALLDGEAQQAIEVQHVTAVSTRRRGCCSRASG